MKYIKPFSMKFVIVFFITLFPFLTCLGQEKKEIKELYRNMSLTIRKSRVIPYNFVKVSFSNQPHRDKKTRVKIKSIPSNNDEKWKATKIDTVFYLDRKLSIPIADSISCINPKDLIKESYSLIADGETFSLEFGETNNTIVYNVDTPKSRTEKRKLSTFYNTCKLIFSTVSDVIDLETIYSYDGKKN